MKNKGKIKNYLLDSFGWNVDIDNFDSLKGKLSYALLGAAQYAIIRCGDFVGIAIAPKSEEDFRRTRNLVGMVECETRMPALLILESLNSYQRRTLIDSRISFIVPNKQIYFPTLGVLMNERGLGVRPSASEKLSSVATAIIVLQLSKKNLQGKSVSQVAKIMGYSTKTISLAVNQLEAYTLVAFKQEGRKKLLDFTLSPKELWEKTYSLADSPVERKMFATENDMVSKIGLKASDSALSEISMLTAPQQDVFAVYARNPRIKELILNSHDGSAIIEIWKTDPALTAVDGRVDIFSLALSYKEDDDPRIRKEIDKIINKTL